MFLNLGYSHDFLIFSYDFIHLLGIDKHYHLKLQVQIEHL